MSRMLGVVACALGLVGGATPGVARAGWSAAVEVRGCAASGAERTFAFASPTTLAVPSRVNGRQAYGLLGQDGRLRHRVQVLGDSKVTYPCDALILIRGRRVALVWQRPIGPILTTCGPRGCHKEACMQLMSATALLSRRPRARTVSAPDQCAGLGRWVLGAGGELTGIWPQVSPSDGHPPEANTAATSVLGRVSVTGATTIGPLAPAVAGSPLANPFIDVGPYPRPLPTSLGFSAAGRGEPVEDGVQTDQHGNAIAIRAARDVCGTSDCVQEPGRFSSRAANGTFGAPLLASVGSGQIGGPGRYVVEADGTLRFGRAGFAREVVRPGVAGGLLALSRGGERLSRSPWNFTVAIR